MFFPKMCVLSHDCFPRGTFLSWDYQNVIWQFCVHPKIDGDTNKFDQIPAEYDLIWSDLIWLFCCAEMIGLS